MAFNPAKHPTAVRVGDLIEAGRMIQVHCNKCAHYRLMDPAELPLSASVFVPALGGRFRCTRCGSRETEARPHYPPHAGGYTVTGWGVVPT